jgi:2-octaprenylphenol hydroxylase
MTRDVIIAGGGMVGATLACALGAKGFRVAVVEAAPPRPFVPTGEYDLRISAISPGSEQVFRALEVWSAIARRRVWPYLRMHVWDAAGAGEIDFDALELGEPRLGHIVENALIQYSLMERSRAFEQVQWLCPDRVAGFELGEHAVQVTLEGGSRLQARLLVGADGPNSRVRALAGIRLRARPYTQHAVVANVRTERDLEHTAWQRFLASGPLAFLPLQDHLAAVVWSTTPGHAEDLVAMPQEAFCTVLGEALGHRLGRIESTTPRAAFPLRGGQAAPYVRPRIALVGDAAHTVHPLAGQGVNLGIMDAATLAEVLVDARRDMGSLRVLRRYERARRADNEITMRVMEAFKQLFGTQTAPLVWARNMGLALADRATPVKHLMMRYAMDRAGELPRLARGLAL